MKDLIEVSNEVFSFFSNKTKKTKNPIRGVEMFIYDKLANNHTYNNYNTPPMRNTATNSIRTHVGKIIKQLGIGSSYKEKCIYLSKNFTVLKKFNYDDYCKNYHNQKI